MSDNKDALGRIAIIGSGDLGQSIAWYASHNNYQVVGFYDDFQNQPMVGGFVVLGSQERIVSDYQAGMYDGLVCAIGYKHFRERESIFNKYGNKYGIPFISVIDKSCHIDPSAKVGNGVVMFPGTFIDKGVVIEDNVLLNVCVTIAHDSCVKAHSFLSPRVAVAGFSTIGRRCMVGINTAIIDNITIGDDIRVGGGNLVTKDLEKPGLYVGVPAKWIKE